MIKDFLKKLHEPKQADSFLTRYLFSTVVFLFPVFFLSGERGIVSSYPVLLPVALLLGVYMPAPAAGGLGAATIAAVVSICDYADITYSLFFSAAVFAVTFLLLLAGHIIRTAVETKRGIRLIAAPIFAFAAILIALLAQWFYFGSPQSLKNAENLAAEYTSANYPEETFENITSHRNFDSSERSYKVDSTIKKGDVLYEISFITDGAKITYDGFFDAITKAAAEKARYQALLLMREDFGADQFTLEADPLTRKDFVSLPHFDEIDSIASRTSEMTFTVTLNEMPTKASLLSLAKSMFTAFREKGFAFDTVIYISNVGDTEYRIILPRDADTEQFENYVVSLDKTKI